MTGMCLLSLGCKIIHVARLKYVILNDYYAAIKWSTGILRPIKVWRKWPSTIVKSSQCCINFIRALLAVKGGVCLVVLHCGIPLALLTVHRSYNIPDCCFGGETGSAIMCSDMGTTMCWLLYIIIALCVLKLEWKQIQSNASIHLVL